MKHFVNTMAIGVIVMYMVSAIMMTLFMFEMSISKSGRKQIVDISVAMLISSTIVTFATLLGTSIEMFTYSPSENNQCYVDNSKIWW